MRSFLRARWLRGVSLALGISTISVSTAGAMQSPPSPDVTEADVTASNAKVKAAYEALAAMWTKNFQEIGEQFAAPAILYVGS